MMAFLDFFKPKLERKIKKLDRSNDWQIREEAARTLGELRDESACRELAVVLQDTESRTSVLVAVSEALGKIGCRDAIAPLTATLGNANGEVRKAAAEALALLGSTKWKEWVRGEEQDFLRLSNSGDKSASPALVSALNHKEKKTILTAIDGLAKLGDKGAIEPLLNMLQHRERLYDRFRNTMLGHLVMGTVPRDDWGPQNIFRLSEEQAHTIDHAAHSATSAVLTEAVRALRQLGYTNDLPSFSEPEEKAPAIL